MKRLDFVFFDAGGGHRAAATALGSVMEQQGRPFEVRMVNLQELLDEIDIFRKITGLRLQDLYNLMLKKGWTLGSAQLIVGMHMAIRLFHGQQVALLQKLWLENRPDLVVSLVPNFNRALYESLSLALPGTPFVTILTDFADYPPHFWMERQRQYLICGTDKAVEQALAIGHNRAKVSRVSGMILNPAFYEMPELSAERRGAERAQLGFRPDQPVGLVLFGGQGAAVMYDIARRLPGRQLLLICGHNQKLAAKLRALPREAPIFVEGFTKEVARYMQLADYFIGKPGPGSISEAIAMRLPVIVVRNAWTLPQERYNADWVREQGIGIVLRNFDGIAEAVDELLAPAAYARFRAATEAQDNRAIFEIPDILEQISDKAAAS
ncbi:MAG TPA: glycosyltransferase [Bryobacteraceae bacterium]|jgi:1,2-diacylglycerol 3-beta-galactosyltransferase|nr:glycosyltransferase [Bryobacteraceae bacterium]